MSLLSSLKTGLKTKQQTTEESSVYLLHTTLQILYMYNKLEIQSLEINVNIQTLKACVDFIS
jgi:hypothetical protein